MIKVCTDLNLLSILKEEAFQVKINKQYIYSFFLFIKVLNEYFFSLKKIEKITIFFGNVKKSLKNQSFPVVHHTSHWKNQNTENK